MTYQATIRIYRKEIAILIGCSLDSVTRNEGSLGLLPHKVQVNSRMIFYHRVQALRALIERFPGLDSLTQELSKIATTPQRKAQEPPQEDRRSSVYIIQCEQFVKIGYAENVKARFGTIKLSNPYPVRLIGAYKSDHPREDEEMIHAKLKLHRATGEWFRLSASFIEELEHMLNALYGSVNVDHLRNAA